MNSNNVRFNQKSVLIAILQHIIGYQQKLNQLQSD